MSKILPSYQEFLTPVLYYLGQGLSYKEIFQPIYKHFNFSEEDLSILNKSNESVINNRVAWARTYLSQAGLVENLSRGEWVITPLGKEWLVNFKEIYLSNHILFILSENFQRFMQTTYHYKIFTIKELTKEILQNIKDNGIKPYRLERYVSEIDLPENYKEQEEVIIEEETNSINTIEESLTSTYDQYKSQILDTLQEKLCKMNDKKFETFVIKVLSACGYGTKGFSKTTQFTRDGGIDGIISEDLLGLDKILLQVKRYNMDNKVGSSDIDKFVGALHKNGVHKGIMITSSYFSADALKIIETSKSNISLKLLNGKELAELMYDKNVCMSESYSMKTVKINESLLEEYM